MKSDKMVGWHMTELRGGTCPFKHVGIDVLYGVPVMPIEQLPTVCT